MKVGFSGTRYGMTSRQIIAVEEWLIGLNKRIVEVHHGDCVGADQQFHHIAIRRRFPVEIHPSNHPLRAHCEGARTVRAVLPPLVRNVNIVEATDILLATPRKRGTTGGTWYTIKAAKVREKKTHIILPDGSVIL